jgi:hypothetical protein
MTSNARRSRCVVAVCGSSVTEEAGIGRLFQKSWRYPGQPLGHSIYPLGV